MRPPCNQRVGCLFGQKMRDLAPLSYLGLLDLTLEYHGQQPRTYEVIDNRGVLCIFDVISSKFVKSVVTLK